MGVVQLQADWTDDDRSADGERELVERAKHDREAFAELYRRHYRLLANYVFRRIGDSHATEDLVSDVFLIVLRALPRYRYRGVPVRYWLLRIATNTVNRWARKRQRRQQAGRTHADLEAGEATATSSVPGDRLDERTQRALLSLPPRYQAVLALRYLEGLHTAEVAAVLGCRTGTVKSRLARARNALREKLETRR